MAKNLKQRGWTPVILDFDPEKKGSSKKFNFPCFQLPLLDESALQQSLQEITSKYGAIQGCLHLQKRELQDADAEQLLFQSFLLAKHLKKHFFEKKSIGRSFFVVISQMDGSLGMGKKQTAPSMRGQAGLVKSLQKEWPRVLCRLVDLDPNFGEKDVSEKILQEIMDPDLSLAETAYLGQERRTLEIDSVNWSNKPSQELDKNKVFLVSGGAKGVTAECIIRLAQIHPARFILTGRSKIIEEPEWAKGLENGDLQKAAIESIRQSGEKPTPPKVRDLMASIESNRSLGTNLQRLRSLGAEVEYLAVDVTDEKGLRKALAPLQKKWGPVEGIIHGAGVLADKRIENKTYQDIQRVYQTKVAGLKTLLKVIDEKKLSHLVLFSSAAGFFGNAGQSDYAAANEVLNQYALQFSQTHPECQVVSFNWGPWEGGMVDEDLKKMFEDRGVYVIPLETGTNLFTECILNPPEEPLLVVGSTMGLPESDMPRNEDSIEISRVLKSEKLPVLQDHRIGENAVLPASFAQSWMESTCQKIYPGLMLTQCTDFKVLKGIVFNSELQDSYNLYLKKISSESDDAIKLEAKISSTHGSKSRFHYSCQLELEPQDQGGIDENPEYGDCDIKTENPVDGKAFYENGTLFHGPAFQGVKQLLRQDESGLLLSCNLPRLEASELGSFSRNTFSPMFLDLGYQAMLIWARKNYDCASLPLAMKHSKHFLEPFPEQEFFISLDVTDHNSNRVTGNIVFHDKDSTVFSKMEGAEVTLSKKLNSIFASA